MRLSTLLLIMVGIVSVASYGEDAPNLNLDYAIYVSAPCWHLRCVTWYAPPLAVWQSFCSWLRWGWCDAEPS